MLLVLITLGACYESHSPLGRDADPADTNDRDVPFFDAPSDSPVDVGGQDTPQDTNVDVGEDVGSVLCERDADCPSNACIRDPRVQVQDLASVQLVCGPTSAAGNPGGACEVSADCPRGLCLVSDRCVAACTTDEDCGDNEECQEVMVRGNETALEEVRACVVTFAQAPSWRVFEQVTSLSGAGTEVMIPRTSPQQAVMLQTYDVRPTAFASLTTSTGELLSTPGALPEGPNPVLGFGRPHVVLIPMSAQVPFDANYIAGFRTIGEVNALQRRLEGPRLGPRRIVLEIFTFPARVTVRGDRVQSPRFERLLVQIEREVARTLGVEVAEIRVHPVVGQLADELTVAPATGLGHPNLTRARLLTVGIDEAVLPVLWMRDIEGAFGIAGGIPGPWGVTGTEGTGVGLSVDAAVGEGSVPGTLAHEIGHFLGLYHTVELDGSQINPLTDTPTCEDDDGDGLVAPWECDGTNFMFWTGGRGSTPQQRNIIEASMLTAHE